MSERLRGYTVRHRTAHGTCYTTVDCDAEGRPVRVITRLGKAGQPTAALCQAVGKLLTLALEAGGDPAELADALIGIQDEPHWDEGEVILSIPDAIGRALSWNQPSSSSSSWSPPSPPLHSSTSSGSAAGVSPERQVQKVGKYHDACPECYNPLAYQEGCETCHSCGYSKCS